MAGNHENGKSKSHGKKSHNHKSSSGKSTGHMLERYKGESHAYNEFIVKGPAERSDAYQGVAQFDQAWKAASGSHQGK